MVIDEMIVLLKLDPAQFTKGQKEAAESMIKTGKIAEKNNKDQQEANKKTADSFGEITNGIFKLTAAYLGVGAIKSFVADITKSDAAMGRLGRTLNVSASDLNAFEGVGSRFGAQAGSMSAAFAHTADMMADFHNWGQFAPEVMNNIGLAQISISDFTNSATSDIQRFMMVQKALNDLVKSGKKTREEAARIGEGIGYSRDVVVTMLEAGDRMDDLIKKQKEINYLTTADTAAAQSRTEAWVTFVNILERAGRDILNMLTPAYANEQARIDAEELNKSRSGYAGVKAVTGASKVGGTHADRDNNPGNIKYGDFAIRHGAIGADGEFAVFPDLATGAAAQRALLLSYSNRGLRSIMGIVNEWTSGDSTSTQSAYVADVAKRTGYQANAPLDFSNPEVLARFQRAQAAHEGLSNAGQQVAFGGTSSTNTSSTEVNIAHVSIDAKNADAPQLAGLLGNPSFYNLNIQGMVAQK